VNKYFNTTNHSN